MSERRYDDKELAAILRAASEAQAEGISPDDSKGLTLPEIEKLAAEVGIDPRHVAAAAERLEGAPRGSRPFALFGALASERLDRTGEGAFDETGWEDAIGELRKCFGSAGEVSRVGSSREWLARTDMGSAHLTAQPRGGQTRFRLSLDRTGMITTLWMLGSIAAFLGSMALAIIIGGRLHMAALAILSIFVLIGLLTTLAWTTTRRWSERQLADARLALDRLAEMTTEGQATAAAPHAQVEQPLIERLTDSG